MTKADRIEDWILFGKGKMPPILENQPDVPQPKKFETIEVDDDGFELPHLDPEDDPKIRKQIEVQYIDDDIDLEKPF